MRKKFYIETFGCQMNKGDSELIELSLLNSGYSVSDKHDEADILIYNTCSVRQHAEDRVNSRIKSIKKRKTGSIVVIAGCMAQRIGNELIQKGLADLVIGPYESPGIAEIIEKFLLDKKNNLFNSQLQEDFEARINFDFISGKNNLPWHKWVTITHGCENFCSYCIVPYVRGPLISFQSKEIITYVKKLIQRGIKEVTLLGQNVNQYGINGDIPFYRLLEMISKIRGLIRVNFLTSHPKDFDENIISVINDNEVISRSIHLPLQSGSDKILNAMNRQYTAKHYLNIIEKINSKLDRFAVSTDIIVGFPGETEDEYNTTLNMVREIRFDDAFMYAYSPREGTSAYSLTETITRDEKIKRLNNLINLQRRISKEKLIEQLNSNDLMIIEKMSKKSVKEVMGKTSLNHPVITPGDSDDIGKSVGIKITELRGSTLFGERIV